MEVQIKDKWRRRRRRRT